MNWKKPWGLTVWIGLGIIGSWAFIQLFKIGWNLERMKCEWILGL